MTELTHQEGPFPQSPATPELIDFRLGQPSPRLLPLDAIAAAARDRLGAEADPLVLQYGAAAGYESFREALATFLTQQYQHVVAADQLAVTGGTSLALSMVSQQFANPGDDIMSGDPSYFLAANIFRASRLRIIGVPVDDAGIDVAAVEERLMAGARPAFVYCIPSFHNPTGATLAPERARRLVELAEHYDFLIVADEPYPLLYFGERSPCMMSFDEGRGRVISLGTMSKILAPGVRVGWLHAEPPLIDRWLRHGVLASGGCVNPVMASVVHGTLTNGFLADHVAMLRHTLAARAEAMVAALSRELDIVVTKPQGGYFVWLDAKRDTTRLLTRARHEFCVGFSPGDQSAIERDLNTHLRLSFAFYEVNEIEEGIVRLAAALA